MKLPRGWLVLAVLLTGCGARYALFPETEEYLVAKGDTLYSIAWANELDPEALARWNGLKSPYLIYPGQPLVLHPTGDEEPEEEELTEEPPVASKPDSGPVAPRSPPPSKPTAVVKPAPPAPVTKPAGAPLPVAAPPPVVAPVALSEWRWPADGAAQRANASGDTSRTGLQIFGKIGQPVRAARAGRVVYAGSGLQGYGLLAIVKHDDTFLSAYGHNDRLLVREGDAVTGGQTLAEMGEGPGQKPLVYFEVRRKGKPIDPLSVLPKRS